MSLKNMLDQEELLKLPLSEWNDIFKEKDGVVFFGPMYEVLKAKIEYYDQSSDVNSFYFKDKQYWFDKATRSALYNAVGTIPIILGDEVVEFDSDKLRDFISKLELYAIKCYVNTQQHLLTIKQLKTIGDIINYEYTSGYPEKLILNE